MAPVVAHGLPEPVTQRGNRRHQIFFADADYAEYRRLMAASCAGCGTEVWAYCLMPNHVHLIVPAGRCDETVLHFNFEPALCFLKPASPRLYERELGPVLVAYL
jgi:hypothetical protein